MSSSFIFNQYYIDFVKRVKSFCKEQKEKEVSIDILSKIKKNYSTMDKTSSEYIDFLNNEISNEKWQDFVSDEDWFDNNNDIKIFKDINVGQISEVIDDNYLFLHFMTVFYIFRKEMPEEINIKIVKIMQESNNEQLLQSLEDDNVKSVLTRLFLLRSEKIKEGSGFDMKFIEDTTIGKLAKEIMQDIDVDKLKRSIDDNGDVLKAIGDPNSGFAEIITSVSQKMANKISNGELKQENIMNDVMKFASAMPGMSGNRKNGSPNMPDMGGMMDMMQMMSSMMGNKDMGDMFKNMTAGQKVSKGQRTTVNNSALKKMAQAKKMKKKLYERNKESKLDTTDE